MQSNDMFFLVIIMSEPEKKEVSDKEKESSKQDEKDKVSRFSVYMYNI